MRRRLIVNSISGSALLVTHVGIAFFLSPILVRTLGNRDYGIWEILISLFGYLSILDLGVVNAIVRHVAQAAAQADRRRMDALVSTALALLLAAGAIGFSIMAVLGIQPAWIGLGHGAHSDELRLVFLVLGLNLLVQLPGTVFSGYQFGLQRHGFVNGVRVAQALAQGCGVYLVLTRTQGPYLVFLAGVLAAANALQFLVLAVVSLSGARRVRLDPGGIDKTTIAQLLGYGVNSVLLTMADRLQRLSVPMVIGAVLGAGQVVYYALPNRLVTYATSLAGALALPLIAYFSHLQGKGATLDENRREWFLISRALQLMILGLAAAVIGLGEPFISVWIGPEYAARGAWVIRILGASLIVEAIAPAANQLLLGRGRHAVQARVAVLVGAVGIPLYFIAAGTGELVGVSLAFVAVRLVTLVAWTRLACRELNLGTFSHLTRTVGRFIPAVVAAVAFLLWLRHREYPGSYPDLLIQGLAGAAVYLVPALGLGLTGRARGAVIRRIRSR